jgi:hypothetical protein
MAMVGFLGLVLLAIWVARLVWMFRLHDRVNQLERQDEARAGAIAVLESQVRELKQALEAASATRADVAPTTLAPPSLPPAPAKAIAAPQAPSVSIPAPTPRPAPAAAPPGAPPPTPAAAAPRILPPLPPPAAVRPVTAAPASQPVGPPAPPAPPTPPAPPSQPFDWEALVGVKLFSWVAGILMALAAIYFLGYSIQNGWLQPPVRMAIGIVVGIGLLVACELRVARRYAVTANAMDAAGIVILFSTFFASHALWGLIGALPTFVLLVLVTAVAVVLAIRRDSIFVALLGLVGGFSTPALLSTGQDNPVGLFGYLLLLNAGLAWVAYRKRWVVLAGLSLALTTLYQWGWVFRFLSADRLPLAGGIFLVFPVLAVAALAILGRDRASMDESDPTGWVAAPAGEVFRVLAGVNAALPLLFSIHMATVPAYGEHYGILFGFLFLVDAGLYAVARWRGPRALHTLGGASTVVVFLAWLAAAYAPGPTSAWPSVLSFVALFVVFYLACGLADRRRAVGADAGPDYSVYAAPLLLVVFPVLAANEPAFASPVLGFSVLFVLIGLIAAYAIYAEAGVVYFIATLFALATEAVWSGLHLEPERLLSALVIYGGFGLFYLGVPLAARRWRRTLRPEGLPGVLLLASIALLFFLSFGAVASAGLWGLAALLAVLNLALFTEGGSRRPALLAAGSILSWAVLLAWWLSGNLATQAIAAMIIVGGFSLLTLGGHLFAAAGTGSDAARRGGMAMALVGHLFLLFVAVEPSLSVPPWPMFGVLAVLDLAIGVAALYVRRAEVYFGAIVVTQAILIAWVVTTSVAPWPTVGAFAAGATAALALAWSYLATRRVDGPGRELFHATAAAGALLAQVLLIVAAFVPGAPAVGTLTSFHVALAVALLAFATLARLPLLTVAAVLPAWFATWSWQALHPEAAWWWAVLEFSTPLYLVFLAYPLAIGRWVERRIEPHLAAVLASASYFHVSRLALVAGGHGAVIGALPVAQAVLLGALLVGLLRLEAPGQRTLGRLALVAGAALAFITVAIPLQLEKEWVTIGWALEGAALAWLFTRIPHRGLFWSAVALFGAVFVRLALNPEVLAYQPRGSVRILNWYLYTYLLAAAAMFAGAAMLSKTDDRFNDELPRASSVLPGAATVLLFLLLNIEIADFFATGPTITFNLSAGLGQDLTYTLGWAVFAVLLLTAGIWRRSHVARLSAIGLLTVTVLKGFLHDTARLGGLYRVFSFVGLAVCLSLVAVVLQKFVLQRKRGETE